MTKVHIEYCGMAGEGRTLTEARKDAAAKLTKAMRGSYTPAVLRFGHHLVLFWREPHCGPAYRIIDLDELSVGETVRAYANSGWATWEETEAAARMHLAHFYLDDPGAESLLTNPRAVADFRHYKELQARYQRGKEAGLTDDQAHRYMGNFLDLATVPEEVRARL